MWRRRAVVAVAVVAAAGLIRLAAPDTGVPASARVPPRPARVIGGTEPVAADGQWRCAVTAPYAAYGGSGGAFFPPNHPERPAATIPPDRCYRTAADAEAAGSTLAPVSWPATSVRGVYLVPVHLFPACAHAARRLRLTVACPILLPNAAPGDAPAACARGACGTGGAFVLHQPAFGVPPGAGVGANLVVAAARPGGRDTSLRCPNAAPAGRTRFTPWFQGHPVRHLRGVFVRCPHAPTPLGDHLLLRWTSGGVRYGVGLSADTAADRRILEILAASLSLVRPSSGRQAFRGEGA
jgi:hypothetical protein